MVFEPIETIAEAKRELRKLTSCATQTDKYIARCLPLMMQLYLDSQKKPKTKRKPSDWQLFMGEQLRSGKPMTEVAQLWKNKKEMLSR